MILGDEFVARHRLVVDVAAGSRRSIRVTVVGVVRVLRGGWWLRLTLLWLWLWSACMWHACTAIWTKVQIRIIRLFPSAIAVETYPNQLLTILTFLFLVTV